MFGRCQRNYKDDLRERARELCRAKVTGIPTNQFITGDLGRKREGYKGVCIVHYYSLKVRRFLDAIGQGVIDKLLNNG